MTRRLGEFLSVPSVVSYAALVGWVKRSGPTILGTSASGMLYFGEMCHHLKRTGGRAGLQMMCGRGGIGIATLVEAV